MANSLGHLAKAWLRLFYILTREIHRLGWNGCLQRRGVSSFANLAQHEQHVLLASQRSQQRGTRQRLELVRSHPEALDEFMVAAEFFDDFVRA